MPIKMLPANTHSVLKEAGKLRVLTVKKDTLQKNQPCIVSLWIGLRW